jgi:hypothetical protein
VIRGASRGRSASRSLQGGSDRVSQSGWASDAVSPLHRQARKQGRVAKAKACANRMVTPGDGERRYGRGSGRPARSVRTGQVTSPLWGKSKHTRTSEFRRRDPFCLRTGLGTSNVGAWFEQCEVLIIADAIERNSRCACPILKAHQEGQVPMAQSPTQCCRPNDRYLALQLESERRTLRTTSLTWATIHGFGIKPSKPYLRKSDRTGASE